MSLETFLELEKHVPNVPELLLEKCSQGSALTREKIIEHQRYSILLLFVRQAKKKNHLIQAHDDFLNLIHSQIDRNLYTIAPQQIQHISFLVEYIMNNPKVLIQALLYQASNDTSSFDFLCFSSIPAIFGFFSCGEFINYAFSFYCTVVGTNDEKIIDNALIPFFCNSCTHRFIENIYAQFGIVFCHDIRLSSKNTKKAILESYEQLLITTIIQAYPLLPHAHQFLLKFMITRGRDKNKVLEFFVHKFTLPQLLRYLKATPFTSHFLQLKALAVSLTNKLSKFLPILDIFSSPSFFEVPNAFTIFDSHFTQLLLTKFDIQIVLKSLLLVTKLPDSLSSLIEMINLNKADFIPIWVKLYFRNPKPMEASFNWKPLVFNIDNNDALIKPQNETEKKGSQNLSLNSIESFNRMYNQIKRICDENNITPINFLYSNRLNMKSHVLSNLIKAQLGKNFESFSNFVIGNELDNLKKKSVVFEHYLVHSLSLKTLEEWSVIVEEYYFTMIAPFLETKLEHLLQKKIQLRTNTVSNLINYTMDNVDLTMMRQLLLMMVIHKLIPMIVPSDVMNKLKSFDEKWKNHLLQVRELIVLPESFKDSKINNNLLYQKLWSAIHHLNSMVYVKFEWTLKLIIDAMIQLDEICKFDDSESSLVQFAVAFCQAPLLISRFILINIFVIHQNAIHVMKNESKDLFLWSRFETAIIKILSKNATLMQTFLDFQNKLNIFQQKFISE